ncbi:MAG: hypothetical protein IIB31_06230 [Chloroflexi bacterium]|nr:hypothetical protein [Chloroflexota bacterium]
MPKREDERQIRLSGKHPVYCTCTQCTERFLNKRSGIPGKGFLQRLFKKSKVEPVKLHPADCTCATCDLLRSVNTLPPSGDSK